MKLIEKTILKNELQRLTNSEINDLCKLLNKPSSVQKPTMIKRIINSNYEYKEIKERINDLNMIYLLEDRIKIKYLREICENNGISKTGSRHDLLINILKNNIFNFEKLLNLISVTDLNQIYEEIYKKMPRMEKEETLSEIFKEFNIVPSKIKTKEIEEIEPLIENFCFILMPFTSELTLVYNSILKPTVEKMGLKCKRADDFFTVNKIMDDIESAIHKAKIIIADLTDRNPNVFYETGLSHAWDKKVILISQSKDDIPFDLTQWRYIVYSTNQIGLDKLSKDLSKTIDTIISKER